jgi:hypothetical protein
MFPPPARRHLLGGFIQRTNPRAIAPGRGACPWLDACTHEGSRCEYRHHEEIGLVFEMEERMRRLQGSLRLFLDLLDAALEASCQISSSPALGHDAREFLVDVE